MFRRLRPEAADSTDWIVTPRLYTIAPAGLSEADAWTIRGLRRRYHSKEEWRIVPHVTLIFGYDGLVEEEYVRHVQRVAARLAPVCVTLTDALAPEATDAETNYVYLIAPGADARLREMHAALYQGALAPALRHDLHYVPHLTVGCLYQRTEALALAKELNAKDLAIDVTIDRLAVYADTDSQYRLVKEIAL